MDLIIARQRVATFVRMPASRDQVLRARAKTAGASLALRDLKIPKPSHPIPSQGTADVDGMRLGGDLDLDSIGRPLRRPHRARDHGKVSGRERPYRTLGRFRSDLDVKLRAGTPVVNLGPHRALKLQTLGPPGRGGEHLLKPTLTPPPRC